MFFKIGLLYVFGSILDFSISVYMCRLGYQELNIVLSMVIDKPVLAILWEIFVFLAVFVGYSLGARKLLYHVALREKNPEKRAKNLRVAEKWWIAPLTLACVRWLAFTHNLILLTTGIETPLILPTEKMLSLVGKLRV